MAIGKLQTYIESIENDTCLYEERNFYKRNEVLDFIGFQVMDQIEEQLQKTDRPDKLLSLKYRAEKVRSELEQIDNSLFQRLRDAIRTMGHTGKAFKRLLDGYVDPGLCGRTGQGDIGYDDLDLFINGLFFFRTMPEQTKDLEPEMVYYQKTPARIVFELVEQAHFQEEDVFFDLGSGLGQVTILVHLLSGVTAKGVEFEPAFCDYARNCAAELNLHRVTFIYADARKADYSEGTVFFMFTPFRGEMLQDVLAVLRKEALQRTIRIITYGPCTALVARESWLEFVNPGDAATYAPGIFRSCGSNLQVQ